MLDTTSVDDKFKMLMTVSVIFVNIQKITNCQCQQHQFSRLKREMLILENFPCFS